MSGLEHDATFEIIYEGAIRYYRMKERKKTRSNCVFEVSMEDFCKGRDINLKRLQKSVIPTKISHLRELWDEEGLPSNKFEDFVAELKKFNAEQFIKDE